MLQFNIVGYTEVFLKWIKPPKLPFCLFPISFVPFVLLQLCCHFINLFNDYFLWNFLSLLTTIHLIDCISSFLSVLFVPCCLMVWVFFILLLLLFSYFPSDFLLFSLWPLLIFNLSLPLKTFRFSAHFNSVKLYWPQFFMSQNFGTLVTYLLHAYSCFRCTELYLVVNHNTKFPGK